jgi:hypothetical protein
LISNGDPLRPPNQALTLRIQAEYSGASSMAKIRKIMDFISISFFSVDMIKFGAYPNSPGYHKKFLWERLPAAKSNDRGWKPLPQPA